jgi:hypothetical protein
MKRDSVYDRAVLADCKGMTELVDDHGGEGRSHKGEDSLRPDGGIEQKHTEDQEGGADVYRKPEQTEAQHLPPG